VRREQDNETIVLWEVEEANRLLGRKEANFSEGERQR